MTKSAKSTCLTNRCFRSEKKFYRLLKLFFCALQAVISLDVLMGQITSLNLSLQS